MSSRFCRGSKVPTDNTKTLTKTEQKIVQMMKLAAETGFVCEPVTKFRQEFLTAINSHLVHRSGKNVYQSPAFTIPMFSREAALNIFGEANLVTNSPTTLTWRIDDLAVLSSTFGDMLSETGMLSAGLTRALKTENQKVVRVLATIIPPCEMSVVQMPRGVDRMYVNFMYVVSDEDGEVHYPKDNQRREISFSAAMETAIRQKILADARRLVRQGAPLSARWLQQLKLEPEAQLMLAAERSGAKPPKLLQVLAPTLPPHPPPPTDHMCRGRGPCPRPPCDLLAIKPSACRHGPCPEPRLGLGAYPPFAPRPNPTPTSPNPPPLQP